MRAALLVYDWLLCLGQEIRFIWTWRSRKFTLSSLVYALSRYTPLISNILAVTTVYPMSDLVRNLATDTIPSDSLINAYATRAEVTYLYRPLPRVYVDLCRLHMGCNYSCRAIVGTGITMEVLGVIASSGEFKLLLTALVNMSNQMYLQPSPPFERTRYRTGPHGRRS